MRSCLHGWCLVAGLLGAGCQSNQRFEEVAPGVSVSRESIDEYAEQHGVSRDEAKSQILAEVTSSGATDPGAKGVKALEAVSGQELDGRPPR